MKNHESHDSHRGSAAVVDETVEKVSEASNRLSEAIDAAKETYAGLQKNAVARARKADKLVRDNPYQAMGIALGLGAILGFLLSRSRD